jgi:hypothetical protein
LLAQALHPDERGRAIASHFDHHRAGTRHLEKLPAAQQSTQETGDLEDCFHVDGVRAKSTDVNLQIATPAHLNGVALSIFADGYQSTGTPAAAALTLANAATVVHAGRPVISRLVSMPLDVVAQDGATHGRRKKAVSLNLALYRSRGGSVVFDSQERGIDYGPDSDLSVPPPLVTSWIGTTAPGHTLRALAFEITHDSPHPFTVRAGNLEWTLQQP